MRASPHEVEALTMDVTDDQGAILHPLIPAPRRRPDGRGRPWCDAREVLNGMRWI
jgi:hypothetical protein